ncbi:MULTISPECIES: uridine kinase family protein [Streptomyces]
MDPLRPLAERLHALAPSCGRSRLVAVDGHAGSGKSTFAGRLAAAAEGPVPVLHLDDLATHEELFDWTGRMLEEVVEPLAQGRAARFHPYDWNLRRFLAPRVLPAAPLVLVEGVGAGRRALRPHLAALLWMDRPAQRSWARGRGRDGPELAAFWDGWMRAESAHFAADPSRPFADLLVQECPEGYLWRKPPEGAPSQGPECHRE